MTESAKPRSKRKQDGEFPESVIAAFRDRSQLDFDVDFYARVLERDPNYIDVLRCQGELLTRQGHHQQGLEVDQHLVELLPEDEVALYNLACSLALMNRVNESVETLRRAIECGYDDLEYLLMDSDLDSLREDPEYLQLLEDYGIEA